MRIATAMTVCFWVLTSGSDRVMSSPSGFTYAFLAEPEGRFHRSARPGRLRGPPTPDFQLLGFPDYNCDGRANIAYRDSGTNVSSGASGLGATATPLQLISEAGSPAGGIYRDARIRAVLGVPRPRALILERLDTGLSRRVGWNLASEPPPAYESHQAAEHRDAHRAQGRNK